ncbi:carboxypeptidase-like regulatory domain-containing protein [Flavobacterium sp. MFBS3-15]|uniref:carboxypeptidase-like regulatory domain-containing protein n=1 Tax=Flavobacterium sp. MFBS3-15 TaxID=2989816 RepID=UPI002236AF5A|nr:carboxypeptidase-like regulatory domain-containing protein [Flavobacterium sp. MFBS3-15]MCW4467580.1 carboxypeptidase-like regulatory domain-containing protein [Flavobacterium sp. MFBS3-15]
MKKPIQLSIPEPCHENWNAMTPADKGRFCASCQKNVIDFIRSSDREIVSAFAKDTNLCGRFNSNQLERALIIPAEKSSLWPVAAALVSFISLAPATSVAQTPESTEQTPGMKMGKILLPPAITVTGMVSDAEGPLTGAKVAIQNTAISVETDADGTYAIEARPGQTLVFTYRDFEIQKNVVLRNAKIINAKFEIEEIQNEVVIEAYRTTTRAISGQVYMTTTIETTGPIKSTEKKRTFFGRIFHSIGNLFR